jgi:hypothetical protein
MNTQKGFSSFVTVLIVLGVLVVGVGYYFWQKDAKPGEVARYPVSFEECVAVGNPVMESYPRRCSFGGREFIENIENESEKADLIRVTSPRPNALVGSPLLIEGEARGPWFFEGDFPARIFDAGGVELGAAPVFSQGEWMTAEFVPFRAELEFSTPFTEQGELVLYKDNPSDRRELDDELRVPVRFDISNLPSERRVVELYYHDYDDGEDPCDAHFVLPVRREIPVTITPIQDVVRLLLKGQLTDAERAQGFGTEFPLEGVSLVGANLQEGVLTLELSDPNFRTSGGACRAGLLRAQVEKTVLQFDTVDEVRFTPPDLFQP